MASIKRSYKQNKLRVEVTNSVWTQTTFQFIPELLNDAVNLEDFILLKDWMIAVLDIHLPRGTLHNYDLLGLRAEFCTHDLLNTK